MGFNNKICVNYVWHQGGPGMPGGKKNATSYGGIYIFKTVREKNQVL